MSSETIAPVDKNAEQQQEFTIHEYDTLRKEIEIYLVELRKLEVYAVVATALFDSFLISLEVPKVKDVQPFLAPWWAWSVPILFPILALVRGWAFSRQIKRIADYLREIEKSFKRIPLGWEHHMKRVREQNKQDHTIDRSSRIFAMVLCGFSTFVFIWQMFIYWTACSG